MKILIRYIISITLALLASWIVYTIIFEITEYLMPSKRYNANGEPEFVMPTAAIFNGFIASLVTFISIIIWINKYFKKNHEINDRKFEI